MRNILSIVLNEFQNDNRVLNEALSLDSAGYKVTIVAMRLTEDIPSTERIGNVDVRRIDRISGRGIIYKIPLVGKVVKVLKFNFNLYRFLFESDCSIAHCHDLDTLEYGIFLKMVKGKRLKLVYDAHEYETQRNGLRGISKLFAIIKERLLIRFCNKVLTVSNTIAEEYVRIYGIKKPTVVLNCPARSLASDLTKYDLFRAKFSIPSTSKIFLYQGYLMPGRGIETLLKAFARLQLPNAVLVFMGEGKLAEAIQSHPNFGASVFLHPLVGREVLLQHTSSADFGVAFIEDTSLSYRYCLPNKLFEYIAAGLPVVGSDLPEIRNFITTNGVGVVARDNSIEGVENGIRLLMEKKTDELLDNILRTRSLYNWQSQELHLLAMYKDIN